MEIYEKKSIIRMTTYEPSMLSYSGFYNEKIIIPRSRRQTYKRAGVLRGFVRSQKVIFRKLVYLTCKSAEHVVKLCVI